jgi:hypothetical protein
MTTRLTCPKTLYGFDPIATLFINRWKLSPVDLGLLSAVIGAGFYLTAAGLSGTLWSKPGQTGLLQDWLPWLSVGVISPIVVGYYLWSFQAIQAVIENLEQSDVLDIDPTERHAINQIAFDVYGVKWRTLLALSSAIAFSIFVFATRSGLKNSWTNSALLPIATVTLATFVVVYMGSVLVLNLIANIWILHRILKQTLKEKNFKVHPLHPDRCGGLRSLSAYALKTAYLAAVLGVMVGLIEYQFLIQGNHQQPGVVHLIIPLHLLLSIACFFGPLIAAHRGMRKAKDQLLHEIAQQFQTDYTQIHASLKGNAEALKKGSEKIQELRAFYSLTDEFPVWPFNIPTFRRFLLTMLAPFLPLLIGALQKIIEALLKKWGIA